MVYTYEKSLADASFGCAFVTVLISMLTYSSTSYRSSPKIVSVISFELSPFVTINESAGAGL